MGGAGSPCYYGQTMYSRCDCSGVPSRAQSPAGQVSVCDRQGQGADSGLLRAAKGVALVEVPRVDVAGVPDLWGLLPSDFPEP